MTTCDLLLSSLGELKPIQNLRETPDNHLKKLISVVLISLAFLLLTGCAVKPIRTVPQPAEMNLAGVRAVIEDGDWVLIRGVTRNSNIISTVTNMPFTHASIYDAENDSVVESIAEGVKMTTLEYLLGEAQRIWVLKPIWATPENRHLAVERARSNIGSKYNYSGLIGLNTPGTYYCTQLVIDAWRPFMDKREDNPIPHIVAPGSLHHWGRVVYDSMEIGENRNKGEIAEDEKK